MNGYNNNDDIPTNNCLIEAAASDHFDAIQ